MTNVFALRGATANGTHTATLPRNAVLAALLKVSASIDG